MKEKSTQELVNESIDELIQSQFSGKTLSEGNRQKIVEQVEKFLNPKDIITEKDLPKPSLTSDQLKGLVKQELQLQGVFSVEKNQSELKLHELDSFGIALEKTGERELENKKILQRKESIDLSPRSSDESETFSDISISPRDNEVEIEISEELSNNITKLVNESIDELINEQFQGKTLSEENREAIVEQVADFLLNETPLLTDKQLKGLVKQELQLQAVLIEEKNQTALKVYGDLGPFRNALEETYKAERQLEKKKALQEEEKSKKPVTRDGFYDTQFKAASLRRELFVQDKEHVSTAAQKTLDESIVLYQQNLVQAKNTPQMELAAVGVLLDIPMQVIERDRENVVNAIHDIITKPTHGNLDVEKHKAIYQWVKKINLGEDGKGKTNGKWSVYQPESYTIPKELEGVYSKEDIEAIGRHAKQIEQLNQKHVGAEESRTKARIIVGDVSSELQKEGQTNLLEVLKQHKEVGPIINEAESLIELEGLRQDIALAKEDNGLVLFSDDQLKLDFSTLDFTGVEVNISPEELAGVKGFEKAKGLYKELVEQAKIEYKKQVLQANINQLEGMEFHTESLELVFEANDIDNIPQENIAAALPYLMQQYASKIKHRGGEIHDNIKIGDVTLTPNNVSQFLKTGQNGLPELNNIAPQNAKELLKGLLEALDTYDRTSALLLQLDNRNELTKIVLKDELLENKGPYNKALPELTNKLIALSDKLFPATLLLAETPQGKRGAVNTQITVAKGMRQEVVELTGDDKILKNKLPIENANLSNIDLSGMDLSNVDFSGSNLKGANLKNANLEKAVITPEQLSGVKGVLKMHTTNQEASIDGDELNLDDLKDNKVKKEKAPVTVNDVSKGIKVDGLHVDTLVDAKKIALTEMKNQWTENQIVKGDIKGDHSISYSPFKQYKDDMEPLNVDQPNKLKQQSKSFQKAHHNVVENAKVINARLEVFEKQLEKDPNAVLEGSDNLRKVMDLNKQAMQKLEWAADKSKDGPWFFERKKLIREAGELSTLAGKYIDKAGLKVEAPLKQDNNEKKTTFSDVLDIGEKSYNQSTLKSLADPNHKMMKNSDYVAAVNVMKNTEDSLSRIYNSYPDKGEKGEKDIPDDVKKYLLQAQEKNQKAIEKLAESTDASIFKRGGLIKEAEALSKDAKKLAGLAAGPSDELLVEGKKPNFLQRLFGKEQSVQREEKQGREVFGKIWNENNHNKMLDNNDVMKIDFGEIEEKQKVKHATAEDVAKTLQNAKGVTKELQQKAKEFLEDRKERRSGDGRREQIDKFPPEKKSLAITKARNSDLFETIAKKFNQAHTSTATSTDKGNKSVNQGMPSKSKSNEIEMNK